MKKITKIALALFIIILIIAFLISYFNFFKPQISFKVNNAVIQVVINEGESFTNNFKITSLGDNQNFKLTTKGLDGLISLSEENFKLEKNEEKTINITFNDSSFKYNPGIYLGKLIIGDNKKEIPIIIEIKTEKVFFVTRLQVNSGLKSVNSGDNIVVPIKIINMVDSSNYNLKLDYFIKNLEGESIFSDSEIVSVNTETQITKTITLPEDINSGNYVFGVVSSLTSDPINYVYTSSYLFNVEKKPFIKDSDYFIVFFSSVIVLILFGILFLVFYLVHERDKLYSTLKKQQKDEIELYKRKIEDKMKSSIKKAKPKEKKVIIRKFKIIKKGLIRKVKNKHKFQLKEFKNLKKKKKKTEIQKKMSEWKNQGFNMAELHKEIKNLPKGGINKEMNNFKKQGFDTSFLKK
ncbi:MAG: hypothetical protein Q7S33_05860 [Nanoarchaeota archaeon]|nr:hypothetical protein [Nanoarchaeota archaeon]